MNCSTRTNFQAQKTQINWFSRVLTHLNNIADRDIIKSGMKSIFIN